MRDACLAILGRGNFAETKASTHGKQAGCLFCTARGSETLQTGERAAILNGHDAGTVLDWTRRYVCSTDLVGRLPLAPPADWLPPLPFTQAFIVDELAIWFCNRGLATVNYHWSEYDLVEIVRVLWEKRIPIESDEMIAVLQAHGLPSQWQAEAEKFLEFGRETLVAARGRPAIRKHRLSSIGGILEDDRRLRELFC